MARRARSEDWGFPRWRPYSGGQDAVRQRECDRHGCTEPGLHPAPKAPNRPERWYFCPAHAAEYNARWDYFSGLDAQSAAEHAAEMGHETRYSRASHWEWTADGTRPRAERDALAVLELTEDATEADIRTAWRRLVKIHHPDANPTDAKARSRFEAVQAAYEILTRSSAAR